MRFNSTKASQYYFDMFGEPLDHETKQIACGMTPAEFDANQPGYDDDGEPLDVLFSAGQWDCIDAARPQ